MSHSRWTASLALLVSLAAFLLPADEPLADEPLDIGSRRELFVDRVLVDRLEGDAVLKLQQPEPREVVLVTDKPWEGNTCAYYTLFQDGERYRMYYRGSHWDERARKAAHREVTCYAESKDGIQWTKPSLGLFEFEGSKDNNIVWDGPGTHCFAPFKDDNPACADDAKYKALGRVSGGLVAFKSPDGIHWSLYRDQPVITKGAFDSQNLAFWDAAIGKYREYHRAFRGVRDIMTGTSDDFLEWTEPVFLEYPGAAKEHLYTNAIRPYERAPHILLGFPTRFQPSHQQVEPTLMASRDGRTFHRWADPLIPITAPEDRDGNRSNYMTWGLLRLPGDDKQRSVYATEAYYTGPDSRVRRFVFRVDGFVSAHAKQGAVLTPPIRFTGKRLELNFRATDGGSVRVELQDASGKPLDGFQTRDCRALQGDSTEQTVTWESSGDLGAWAGKPVRLRFELQNADVYSFRFQ